MDLTASDFQLPSTIHTTGGPTECPEGVMGKNEAQETI
jgi:hypothetical protein